jgi:hypothetical protein
MRASRQEVKPITFVRLYESANLREAVKYPIKPMSVNDLDGGEILDLAAGFAGHRAFGLFGTWAREKLAKRKEASGEKIIGTTAEVLEAAWRGEIGVRSALDAWGRRNLGWDVYETWRMCYDPDRAPFQDPDEKPPPYPKSWDSW